MSRRVSQRTNSIFTAKKHFSVKVVEITTVA